ncbi:MAG: DUF503 domain-containing protein [Chloroflexi bacterium]|nr:DUF503 domain-containing protein [Chloroflexota bacterium]
MIIAACTLEIHLPDAASLKDKRSVIKSLLARLHNSFNVSAAEVDHLELWQSSVIGLAVVSNSNVHAQQMMTTILDWIETHYPNIFIVRHKTELR